MAVYFDPTLSPRPGFEATLRSQVMDSANPVIWPWYFVGTSAFASLCLLFSSLYVFDYLYYLISI